MKIRIILSNNDGGDQQVIDVRDDNGEMSHKIIEAIKAWSLVPGDTIKIVEVS